MELKEARIVAQHLRKLGYKQVSNRFRLIARVDIKDKELINFFIKENFGDTTSSIPCLSLEDQKDYYRRCYATGLEAPEEVMRELRKLGAVAT